ncbi:unknown [Brachyspira sp. CAG:484]|nr:unknown [Brachyspira sp. CAG:484]
MKKGLVILLAATVLSMGTVQAAEASGPVSRWLNNITAKVSHNEQTAAQKAQARKQKAAQKRAKERQKQLERQRKAAAKKAEAQKKEAERKKRVEAKKKQWKELFTIEK